MSFKRPFDEADLEFADNAGSSEGSALIPLTQAQMNELDRRLEELDGDPDGGVDWVDLREELLHRVARRRASAA